MSRELQKQLEDAQRPLKRLEALQAEESHEVAVKNHNHKLYESRFLRLPAVTALTGLSRSTIYEKMEDGEFPKPVPLGEKSVAWIEGEVHAWMLARIAARDKADEAEARQARSTTAREKGLRSAQLAREKRRETTAAP